jgi:hypothetical protein
LKTFCLNLLKVTTLAIIAASSFLALTNRYGENQWDAIQAIQQLKNQNRRDDAIDLVNFLKENQTHETDDLHKMEKEVAYSPLERAKAFVWDGVVKGNVNDTYSGIGSLATDFCLYGDIRDITKQTWNLLFDQANFDGVVSVLSGAGIALSTMPMFDGLYAMNKSTAKYVSKLPTSMNKGTLKSFLSGRASPEQSSTIYNLLKKTDGRFPAPHLS